MIQDNEDGTYEVTVIDFDNSQRSWFVVDIGTVVWTANMEWYYKGGYESNPDYEVKFGQYKAWIMDSYGWNIT